MFSEFKIVYLPIHIINRQAKKKENRSSILFNLSTCMQICQLTCRFADRLKRLEGGGEVNTSPTPYWKPKIVYNKILER